MAYDERGTGPALLLAHATLHDRRDYDPVVDRLSDHFRVIAFDWPWHGESPGAADQIASAALFADVLEDIGADLELPDVGHIVHPMVARPLQLGQAA